MSSEKQKNTLTEKLKINITLKPVVIFPGMVGGIELTDADNPKVPSVLIVHAGSPIAVAEISAGGALDKTAALMILNHVTKKIAGSAMSVPPQAGMIHADNIPMTGEVMLHGIEKSVPEYEFAFSRGW